MVLISIHSIPLYASICIPIALCAAVLLVTSGRFVLCDSLLHQVNKVLVGIHLPLPYRKMEESGPESSAVRVDQVAGDEFPDGNRRRPWQLEVWSSFRGREGPAGEGAHASLVGAVAREEPLGGKRRQSVGAQVVLCEVLEVPVAPVTQALFVRLEQSSVFLFKELPPGLDCPHQTGMQAIQDVLEVPQYIVHIGLESGAGGPMTTVAQALALEPKLPRLVERVVAEC